METEEKRPRLQDEATANKAGHPEPPFSEKDEVKHAEEKLNTGRKQQEASIKADFKNREK
jgi:hypothetical protein